MEKVYFNEPICVEIKAPAPKGRPTTLSYPEIQNLCRHLREQGWEERAVVVRRLFHPSGMPDMYTMSRPANWGVVVDLRTTTVAVSNTPYLPLKVRWGINGNVTEHWPEDLILIHPAITQFGMEQLVKERLKDA